MKKKSIIGFIIPFSIVSIISLLGYFSSTMKDIDNKLYDAALNIKKLAPVSGKFLNIEVDDKTLDLLKMYPLKRSTLADGMMVLTELGADAVLLDTQLVDKSTPGLNSVKMKELPSTITQSKNATYSMASQLINAYANGQLGGGSDAQEEANDYLADLQWEYDDIFDNLLNVSNQIALNYDDYISNNFSLMGNIYVTNDFEKSVDDGKQITPEFTKYIQETQALKNIIIHEDPFPTRGSYNPSIEQVLKSSTGSGFVETLLDNDGKTRRTQLIIRKDGYYYPHLSFKYYLDRMGNPEIHVYKKHIILKNVKKENREPFDQKIPLTVEGSMAINWAGKEYENTFNRRLFYSLYLIDIATKNLFQTLQKIHTEPRLNRLIDKRYNDVIAIYQKSLRLKNSGDPSNLEEYQKAREDFVILAGELLVGTKENPPVDLIFKEATDNYILANNFTKKDSQQLIDNATTVTSIFDDGRETFNALYSNREVLKKDINGAIVTFGYTATSTFDTGSNPFQKNYFNMGVYSTVVNNLLANKFITIIPLWVSIIMAFIYAGMASLITRKKEAKSAIIVGLIIFSINITAFIALFYLTGIYIYILIPGLSFILVFIEMISGKLLSTSKDKAFIKNAFGQYLSEDVIKDIINDPSKLQLGGEEKEITAFFTDVKGFSTISEKLTPDELVTLLNEYLTAMSDIALEHKGTIDKYEGDAIIGFFGAPAPLPDHATKAVIAAIRMKEMEDRLNIGFKEKGMTPTPLQTRIGLNSGPCVVGNMGTPKKMDYTMMGSDVNIAARLEGVNKQYGTWILASERTMNKAEDLFLSRRLDRVRVVGINEPIRLFNPVALKSEASQLLIDTIDAFESALTLFEERKWEDAHKAFKKVLTINSADTPSVRYIQLCEKFMVKAPEKDWDGVFNLTSK
ncbi:MAG: hypothetical protein B6229_09435 [Spirochaetaceae bacterium 4572_7]|nr:MAG: hypothetical protein B6229_09435 [Spirochaetaceae bacterium 4572_7]